MGIARRKIPAAVGSIADRRKTLYAGAFGVRDAAGVPVRLDSIFRIASMTKPVTTVAALQLVEQGKVDLSEPVAKHLPQLANLDVLEGFDSSGKPVLRPARTPITLHHLLTQTSGLCYPTWDEQMFRYSSAKVENAPAKPGPLMFEPGTRWQYGQGTAWAARLVEAITGATLEDYFQERILRPLGMQDTSYIFPEAKFDRLRRQLSTRSQRRTEAERSPVAEPADQLQRGRRAILNRCRLRAVHADDPQSRRGA